MKKLLCLSTMACVVFLGGCAQNPSKVNNHTTGKFDVEKQAVSQTSSEITEDGAKEIALNHAKLNGTDVTFVKSKIDIDNGTKKYEIEFYADNVEYDYDINAATGEIISWDKEIENYAIPKETATQSGGEITESRAKEIALGHANLHSTDVTFVKSNIDIDNGIKKYEIEFYADNVEYDYDINAATGEIISWDKEIENYTIPKETAPQSGGEITESRAKEIALSHAKLLSTDVTFVKSDIDIDNGIKKYEIEFYAGNVEYDYDINAATGEIISWDKEIDND